MIRRTGRQRGCLRSLRGLYLALLVLATAVVAVPTVGRAPIASAQSAPDYATEAFGDPWDMSNLEDVFVGGDGPMQGLGNARLEGDALRFTVTEPGYFHPLWGGWPEAARQARDGALHPIDTDRYRYAIIKITADQDANAALVGFSCQDLGKCQLEPQFFTVKGGTGTYVVKLWANQRLVSLRYGFSPLGGPANLAVDWIRVSSDEDTGDGFAARDRGQPIGPLNDWATRVRRDPWDFEQATDIEQLVNVKGTVTNGQLTGVATDVGSPQSRRNVPPDPGVVLAGPKQAPIEASRWRYAFVFMDYDGPFNHLFIEGGGTVGRILWRTRGARRLGQTKEIPLYPVQKGFFVDLGDPANVLPGGAPWAGQLEYFRVDPTEDFGPRVFRIQDVWLLPDNNGCLIDPANVHWIDGRPHYRGPCRKNPNELPPDTGGGPGPTTTVVTAPTSCPPGQQLTEVRVRNVLRTVCRPLPAEPTCKPNEDPVRDPQTGRIVRCVKRGKTPYPKTRTPTLDIEPDLGQPRPGGRRPRVPFNWNLSTNATGLEPDWSYMFRWRPPTGSPVVFGPYTPTPTPAGDGSSADGDADADGTGGGAGGGRMGFALPAQAPSGGGVVTVPLPITQGPPGVYTLELLPCTLPPPAPTTTTTQVVLLDGGEVAGGRGFSVAFGVAGGPAAGGGAVPCFDIQSNPAVVTEVIATAEFYVPTLTVERQCLPEVAIQNLTFKGQYLPNDERIEVIVRPPGGADIQRERVKLSNGSFSLPANDVVEQRPRGTTLEVEMYYLTGPDNDANLNSLGKVTFVVERCAVTPPAITIERVCVAGSVQPRLTFRGVRFPNAPFDVVVIIPGTETILQRTTVTPTDGTFAVEANAAVVGQPQATDLEVVAPAPVVTAAARAAVATAPPLTRLGFNVVPCPAPVVEVQQDCPTGGGPPVISVRGTNFGKGPYAFVIRTVGPPPGAPLQTGNVTPTNGVFTFNAGGEVAALPAGTRVQVLVSLGQAGAAASSLSTQPAVIRAEFAVRDCPRPPTTLATTTTTILRGRLDVVRTCPTPLTSSAAPNLRFVGSSVPNAPLQLVVTRLDTNAVVQTDAVTPTGGTLSVDARREVTTLPVTVPLVVELRLAGPPTRALTALVSARFTVVPCSGTITVTTVSSTSTSTSATSTSTTTSTTRPVTPLLTIDRACAGARLPIVALVGTRFAASSPVVVTIRRAAGPPPGPQVASVTINSGGQFRTPLVAPLLDQGAPVALVATVTGPSGSPVLVTQGFVVDPCDGRSTVPDPIVSTTVVATTTTSPATTTPTTTAPAASTTTTATSTTRPSTTTRPTTRPTTDGTSVVSVPPISVPPITEPPVSVVDTQPSTQPSTTATTTATTTTTTTAVPGPNPTIELIPDVGQAGFVTSVVGKGFAPGERLTLKWRDALGSVNVTVGADGTFRSSLLIFRSEPSGRKTLYVVGREDVTDTFLVTSGGMRPAGDSRRVRYGR